MLMFRDVLQDPEVLSPSTESLLRGPKRSFCPGGRVRVGPAAVAAEVLRLHSPMLRLCRTVRQGWTLGWDLGPLT